MIVDSSADEHLDLSPLIRRYVSRAPEFPERIIIWRARESAPLLWATDAHNLFAFSILSSSPLSVLLDPSVWRGTLLRRSGTCHGMPTSRRDKDKIRDIHVWSRGTTDFHAHPRILRHRKISFKRSFSRSSIDSFHKRKKNGILKISTTQHFRYVEELL